MAYLTPFVTELCQIYIYIKSGVTDPLANGLELELKKKKEILKIDFNCILYNLNSLPAK